jgi:signal transduction histidine kinase
MDTIAPANASPSLRVLLIEDSPDDAELLTLELLDQGHSPIVTRVDTPEDLSRALDQESWDVVLCDHRLPGMDALSALSIVQSRGLDLPFIIVSSVISEQSAVEVMRAGAHDFLYKNSLGKIGAVIERETREAELRSERRRMQQQLLLADRLSTVGMLAAGVAHEINNPLAYVVGNLEFAFDRLTAGHPLEQSELAEVVHSLAQAREGSDRIGHITRDLKVFCRSGADEVKSSVNVRRVMESSISIAWNQIRHRARLTRNFDRVPTISGNENRLGQVFLNLLVNAAQALPDDRVDQNEIVIAIRSEAGNVVVEMRDTGRGMSEEQQARAFEAFFTTKPRGIGSGIGLSICRSIVTDMGGEISCESQLGEGTTFRVCLPANDAVVFSSRPPRQEVPALPRSRILVIDDEPALCAVMRRLLRRQHEVIGYADAHEALKLLEQDDAFDVIFCDIMMPHLSGIDFFNQLRRQNLELASRVVFMTGGAFNAPAQQFLRTVANPLLEKPFEMRTLQAAIAQALEAKAISGTWPTGDSEVRLREVRYQSS